MVKSQSKVLSYCSVGLKARRKYRKLYPRKTKKLNKILCGTSKKYVVCGKGKVKSHCRKFPKKKKTVKRKSQIVGRKSKKSILTDAMIPDSILTSKKKKPEEKVNVLIPRSKKKKPEEKVNVLIPRSKKKKPEEKLNVLIPRSKKKKIIPSVDEEKGLKPSALKTIKWPEYKKVKHNANHRDIGLLKGDKKILSQLEEKVNTMLPRRGNWLGDTVSFLEEKYGGGGTYGHGEEYIYVAPKKTWEKRAKKQIMSKIDLKEGKKKYSSSKKQQKKIRKNTEKYWKSLKKKKYKSTLL